MSKLSRFLFLVLVSLTFLGGAHYAQAKDKNYHALQSEVEAACRHTSGCSYDTDFTNGESAGCSPHACFTCKNGTCTQRPGHAEIKAPKVVKPKIADVTATGGFFGAASYGNSTNGGSGGAPTGGGGTKTLSGAANNSAMHFSATLH